MDTPEIPNGKNGPDDCPRCAGAEIGPDADHPSLCAKHRALLEDEWLILGLFD